jgi:hypothetical protein
MDLSKILAISGKPGLYKMLSQTKSGFIVESLTDGKRMPVFAHERVSSLEEISIFTTAEEDLPLKEVFRKIQAKTEGGRAPEPKAGNEAIQQFFLDCVPEYDPERVYISDMKKVINWYNLMVEQGMTDFSEEDEKEKPDEASPAEEMPATQQEEDNKS